MNDPKKNSEIPVPSDTPVRNDTPDQPDVPVDPQDPPAPDELPVPTEIVENPHAVMASDLSDAEKLRVLEKAETNAEQMMNAAGEGMTGDDLPVLDEVQESIEKIKARQSAASIFDWQNVRTRAHHWVEKFGWRPFP